MSWAPHRWVASRAIPTPLDGPVSVSAASHAALAPACVATLRDPSDDRLLAHAATDPTGSADLGFSNCGHAALRLEVRATSGPADFQAAIARP